MSFQIKDKVALVTGGANGIGLAYVKALLKEGVKNIAVVDLKHSDAVDELIKEYGNGKVIFIQTDVSKKEELDATFEKTVTTFKSLDIVVNNAGVLMDRYYEKAIAINCTAVVQGCLLGIKYMGINNGGRGGVIVNTSSIYGLQPVACCPVYTGTKHFINGFTTSMGTDFYHQLTGIKFLAICPGLTETSAPIECTKYLFSEFPGIINLFEAEMKILPPQPPSSVGESIIPVICNGNNGSLWVIEGAVPPYEVKIPDRRTLRVN